MFKKIFFWEGVWGESFKYKFCRKMIFNYWNFQWAPGHLLELSSLRDIHISLLLVFYGIFTEKWFVCDDCNKNNPSAPQRLKSLGSLIDFLNSMFHRNLEARHFSVNPFVPNAPFLYPLKTSENPTIFWCF